MLRALIFRGPGPPRVVWCSQQAHPVMQPSPSGASRFMARRASGRRRAGRPKGLPRPDTVREIDEMDMHAPGRASDRDSWMWTQSQPWPAAPPTTRDASGSLRPPTRPSARSAKITASAPGAGALVASRSKHAAEGQGLLPDGEGAGGGGFGDPRAVRGQTQAGRVRCGWEPYRRFWRWPWPPRCCPRGRPLHARISRPRSVDPTRGREVSDEHAIEATALRRDTARCRRGRGALRPSRRRTSPTSSCWCPTIPAMATSAPTAAGRGAACRRRTSTAWRPKACSSTPSTPSRAARPAGPPCRPAARRTAAA